jgi:hypothetical protein
MLPQRKVDRLSDRKRMEKRLLCKLDKRIEFKAYKYIYAYIQTLRKKKNREGNSLQTIQEDRAKSIEIDRQTLRQKRMEKRLLCTVDKSIEFIRYT